MKSVQSAGVRTWRIDGARSAPGSAGMAGAPGARPRRSSTPFTTNTFTTRGAPEVPGPAPDRRISPPCASPSRCSQPECWPQPSSGRRAPRRRPRRPRRPRPRPCPARPAAPRRARLKAGPRQPDPIASWGVDGIANAAVVIGNVVYVGGTFSNAVSPTGQTAAHANLAGVLPGRRQRAEHVQRQLRRRSGQRPGHRRCQPLRGRELHHPQRRRPRTAWSRSTPAASATPPSPRSPSRLRPVARLVTDGVLALAYAPRPASSTPVVTSARSARVPAAASPPSSTMRPASRRTARSPRSPVRPTRRSSRSPSAQTARRSTSVASSPRCTGRPGPSWPDSTRTVSSAAPT